MRDAEKKDILQQWEELLWLHETGQKCLNLKLALRDNPESGKPNRHNHTHTHTGEISHDLCSMEVTFGK